MNCAGSDAIAHATQAILPSSPDLRNSAYGLGETTPSRQDGLATISSTTLKLMLDEMASKLDQEDHKA